MYIRQVALLLALDDDPHSLAVLLRICVSRRKLHGADRPVTEVMARREEKQLVREFDEMTEHSRRQGSEDRPRQAREDVTHELGAT